MFKMPVDLNEKILVSLHVVQKLFFRIKMFHMFTSYLYQSTKHGKNWTICNKFKKTKCNIFPQVIMTSKFECKTNLKK